MRVLDGAALRRVVVDEATRLGVVGAQVAVLHGGRIDQVEVGTESVRTGLPVTPDTMFQIGSTTKVFTAVLALQLVEEGLLGLDVPVAEQLPGFTLADERATRTVTPRHLLSMSSGIDNGPYDDHGRGTDALARYVANLATLPLQAQPGEVFGYSNASTAVTGRLIEWATGSTWEQAMRDRLLEPAGLWHTGMLAEDVVGRRHAVGHVLSPGGAEAVDGWPLPRSLGPAGALWSNAADLVRFARVALEGGVAATGHRLLGPDALTEMTRPQVQVPPTLLADFWACGPYGKQWGDVLLLGHSGTSAFGSSYLLWAPEHRVAVATVVNTPVQGYPFAERMFNHVFPHLLGAVPPPAPEVLDVVPEVGRYVGRYEMSGASIEVTAAAAGLIARGSGHFGSDVTTPLRPLGSGVFLPTQGTIDGGRGWGAAFLGPDDAPATHLLNGFFSLRRTS